MQKLLLKTKNFPFFKLINKNNLEDIFTPSASALKCFVEREEVNKIFYPAVISLGCQIILYGKSGCGKSTYLANTIGKYYKKKIITRYSQSITFESILKDAFYQMNEFSEKKITTSDEFSAKQSVNTSIFNFSDSIKSNETIEKVRISEFQLIEKNLADLLVSKKICWIFEDYHRFSDEIKIQIFDFLKICADCKAKIILVGVGEKVFEVLGFNYELNNRIQEVYISLMNDNELREIITIGQMKLNISFTDKAKELIVKMSMGYPSNCHKLCFEACIIKKIDKTCKKNIIIDDDIIIQAIEKNIQGKRATYIEKFNHAFTKPDSEIIHYSLELLLTFFICGKDRIKMYDLAILTYERLQKDFSEYSGESEHEQPLTEEENLLIKKDFNIKTGISYLLDMTNKKRGNVFSIFEDSSFIEFNDIYFEVYCFLKIKDFSQYKSKLSREIENPFNTTNLMIQNIFQNQELYPG